LKQLSPAEALAALDSGAADVALLRLPVAGDHLSSIPLYSELPVVVAPKDHPIEAMDAVTVADLAGESIVTAVGGAAEPLDGNWTPAVELVAANVGVAVMPQSVARALSRRDVIARPVTDGDETRIALTWVTESTTAAIDEFIGIVRGRTANSSRGEPTPPKVVPPRKAKPDRRPQRKPGSGRGR
jgi:DNA-binding transcriptional LysR family regulator